MMNMNKELTKIFDEQVYIEIENAEMLRNVKIRLKNILVKELFESIAHDSMKHASLYKSLAKMSSAVATAMTEAEFEILKNVVEKHIKIEENMIRNIKNMLEKGVDKRVEYILKYILEDEYRHHALLKGMLEAIARREVVSEEEWWDIIWRTTFSRGTPMY